MFLTNKNNLDAEIQNWKKTTNELIEKIKLSLKKQRRFEEEPSAPPYEEELSVADDPGGFNPEYRKSLRKCKIL